MNKYIKKCFVCGSEFKPHGKHDLYCSKHSEQAAKDNESLSNMDNDALLRLSGAILRTAASDYVALVRKWRKAYTTEDKINQWYTIKRFSKWFKSSEFNFMSFGLDGSLVQKQLNKIAFTDERFNV